MLDTTNDPLLDLTRMIRRHTYTPVGICIYCSATGVKLSIEHIIAESLGGMLELPEGSCEACAKETGRFEGESAGKLFKPIRRQLGYPQKNRGSKRRAQTKAEVFRVTINGKTVDVPIAELPGMLVSFRYEFPGALLGLDPVERTITGMVSLVTLPEFQERYDRLCAKHGAREAAIHVNGDSEMVAQLLAKTAHAYAVAELGIDGFKPYLVDAILGKESALKTLGHFVGSSVVESPIGTDLHEIGIDTTGLGGERLVVVRIQLFANRGFPVHYVVVGERT